MLSLINFDYELCVENASPMRTITLQRLPLVITALLLHSLMFASELNGESVEKPFVDDQFAASNWRGTQGGCGVALRQGRRPHQEDRAICMPELNLPGLGGLPDHELSVSLFGVFDGHGGAHVSEMVSTHLPHRLHYHTWSIMNHLEKDYSCGNPEQDGSGTIDSLPFGNTCFDSQVGTYDSVSEDFSTKEKEMRLSQGWRPVRFSDSTYRSILKEALSRSLADIDSAFSNEAWKKGLQGGSTAVVVLKVDGHLLTASIGDSKAFVCSSWLHLLGPSQDFKIDHSKVQEVENIGLSMDKLLGPYFVKELTVDHRPNRVDERARIEAAGGFVWTWGGVPRVNGQLAITRAIGDIPFKKYGVTAEPEFTDWLEITVNETFLFLASDGIFEVMNTQDVCNILEEKRRDFGKLLNSESAFLDVKLYCQAVAEAVVDLAFEMGSMDNLALVAYPLAPCPGQQSPSTCTEVCENKGLKHNIFVQQHNNLAQSGNCKNPWSSTSLPFATIVNTANDDKAVAAFSTVTSGSLLKGEEKTACYELVERIAHGFVLPLQTLLDSNASEVMPNVTEVELLLGTDLNTDLPHEHRAGHLEVHSEHSTCLLHPVLSDDEVCLNPERFATYLSLIEAVPVLENNPTNVMDSEAHGVGPGRYHSYTGIHKRYRLTKNVGRGGFGEIWYAVAQHCFAEGTMGLHFQKMLLGSLQPQNIELGQEGDCFSNTSELETRTNVDYPEELFVVKRILRT